MEIQTEAPRTDQNRKKGRAHGSKKHTLWVLLGATMILLSFFFRECLLDYYRDKRDDAATKCQTLKVRTDIFKLRFEMRVAAETKSYTLPQQKNVENAHLYAQFVPVGATNAMQLTNFFGVMLGVTGYQLANEQDSVADFLEIAWKADTNAAKMLYAYSQKYKSETQKAFTDLFDAAGKAPTHSFQLINSYFTNSDERNHALEKDIVKISENDIAKLEQAEDDADRNYDRVNYSCIGVFVFGWAVALVGRLKGVDIETE